MGCWEALLQTFAYILIVWYCPQATLWCGYSPSPQLVTGNWTLGDKMFIKIKKFQNSRMGWKSPTTSLVPERAWQWPQSPHLALFVHASLLVWLQRGWILTSHAIGQPRYPLSHSISFASQGSSEFYSEIWNASCLELAKYWCINFCFSGVTIPIKLSSYKLCLGVAALSVSYITVGAKNPGLLVSIPWGMCQIPQN